MFWVTGTKLIIAEDNEGYMYPECPNSKSNKFFKITQLCMTYEKCTIPTPNYKLVILE